jgi:hypothetical protein
MKRFSLIAVACLALTFTGAKLLITEAQSYVVGALDELKFEPIPAAGGVVGGPQRYRITQNTINHLRNAANSGKTITVQNDGSITLK